VIAFFDASALIYLIEGREPFAGRVRKVLGTFLKKYPGARAAVSRLTWLECRVGPMKQYDGATLALYDAFFARQDLKWIELTKDVVELATAIRVKHGLKTPDSLQAASCLQLGGNHMFLSGDVDFKHVGGLNVKVLS